MFTAGVIQKVEDLSLSEDEESLSEDEDSLPSSQGSGRFQMGHQMTNSGSYVGSESFIFEKVGELPPALHTSLVCHAMQKYLNGEAPDSLTAHGLHIHRAIGIIHVQLTLSKKEMKIDATHLVNGMVDPGFFVP